VLPSDADARAYVLAVNTADGQPLEAPVVQAIDAFVVGCKADGIWSAIKASCILMGARTLSGALTPLVGSAPTNNNFVAGDYNRKTGLLGDGTTKFLNSNRANNVSGQNDRHSSVYVTTLPASGGVVLGAGGNGAGSTNLGRGGTLGDQLFARSVPAEANSAANTALHSQTVGTGFWGLRRASGTEFSFRGQGVTDLVTATGPGVSGTPSSDNLFIFARNNGSGTANAIAAARLAWYSLGDSLDLSLLDSRVTTLYNAIGAAIP
jgi:hypothetical protein